MPGLRAVGRPMLASIFIMQGFDNLRRIHFVKNLSIPGGLLITAADTVENRTSSG
jgi:hypothetical protein